MRDLFNNRPHALLIMLMLALGLVLGGCGDDDDDDNGPTGPPGGDDFTEELAVQQAHQVVPMVVNQVATMGIYADGITAKADDQYTWGWNGDSGRWEGTYQDSGQGYSVSYDAWLQYRDALGNPQQEALGAASFAYHYALLMTYAYSGDGFSYSADIDAEDNFSAAGLGTDTIVVNGSGNADMDYSYSDANGSGEASYSYGWEIAAPGISYPLNGCPTGTMSVTFAPYTVTVVFDGSNVATYTMTYNGSSVPAGSGTVNLVCGT